MSFGRHRRFVFGVGMLAVALVVSGCALFAPGQVDTTQRDDSGEILKEGTVGAFNISVGDCLNDLDVVSEEETEVSSATGVPCSEPHIYEVYYEQRLEGYTLQALKDAQAQICDEQFERFIGAPYWDTSLEITYLFPTSLSYAQGDRSIQCLVSTGDLSMVTGSLRGQWETYFYTASPWGEVGDCIDVTYDSSGNPLEDRYVSCDEPHVFEVFFVGIASSEALEDIVVEISDFCFEEWDRYKDPSIDSEGYFITPLAPTEETYAQGDRDVACWVHTEFYEPIVGSLGR